MTGLGVAGFVGFAANALQGGESPSGTNWLWVAAIVSLAIAIAGGIGWLLTRNDAPSTDMPTTNVIADRGALGAGRDIRAGRDINITQPAERPAVAERPRPSFDLVYQPDPEGWIHLRLCNLAEPGTFYVDVIDVAGTREHQTVPYVVKWRDSTVDEKRVVKEALIDLGRALWKPGPDITGDGVLFINFHSHKRGGWESGHWQLFSFSKPDGWIVAAQNVDPPLEPYLPEHLRLLFEQIGLTVRVTRTDSGEERAWRVTMGFDHPALVDGRWITPKESEHRIEVREL